MKEGLLMSFNPKLSPQIQLFLQYPYGNLPQSFSSTTGIHNLDVWDVLIKYYGTLNLPPEVTNTTILSAVYATASIPRDLLEDVSLMPEIEYISLPEIMKYIMYAHKAEVCANYLDTKESGFNVTGKGVYFGLADSGVDYTHPDFINPDGTSRILYLWDQTIEGTPPAGFTQGTEYTNEQINAALSSDNPLALVPSVDALNHGTTLCGIAAGNGRSNKRYRGIASNASLVIVKLGQQGANEIKDPIRGPRNIEIMMALKYLVDKAKNDNKPISILIGLGLNAGSHTGHSAIDEYIDFITQTWKVNITVGVGNQASEDSHTSGIVLANTVQQINIFIDRKQPYYYTTIWKNFIDNFGVRIISPNGDKTSMLTREEINSNTIMGDSIVSVNFSQATPIATGEQIIIFIDSLSPDEITDGNWTIELTGLFILDGKYDAWGASIDQFVRTIRFVNPVKSKTLTIPSTALSATSVAATTSNGFDIAFFSGQGYINGKTVKPDIAAPGVDIVSTSAGGGYHTFSGTSAAAAFVAGAYLLMLEYGMRQMGDRYLFGEMLKAYITRSTKRPFGMTFPNIQWGYGELCIQSSLQLLSTLYDTLG